MISLRLDITQSSPVSFFFIKLLVAFGDFADDHSKLRMKKKNLIFGYDISMKL